MRLHFGFSKFVSIKALLKWGVLIVGGLLAFFGIDNIQGKALTNAQAPSTVKRCSYNGLFTDSNCITETPYNCSATGLPSPFSCYVPNTTTYDNIKLDKKAIWYSYTSSTSGNCNTSQTISFNVDVILQDQLNINGCDGTTADCGPFASESLNYNYWQQNPTIRGGLTKDTRTNNLINFYWPYLDGQNSKNKTGLKIYGYSSSTGYQLGSCQFVQYMEYKKIRFLCTAPAKMSTYYVGQNIYNNNGGLGTSSIYARNVQYISNVSDPCVSSSSSDMSGVTSAINNQTGSIMSGFSDVIENNNTNTNEITNAIEGLTDSQNHTNDILLDQSTVTNFNINNYNGGYNELNNSTIQTFVNLPFNMLQQVLNQIDTESCTPFAINLSSITRRWGNFDYTLTVPCIRTKVKSLIGQEFYDLFDYLMCAIVFYYFAMNLYNKIDTYLSGYDAFPIYMHSKGRTTNYYNAHVNDATGEVVR